MALEPGTRLGHHEILAPLGAGGMGEVYLARDTRLDREVALKLLPERMTRDPESVARFRREALALASLNHPNIATVHGFEETPEGPMVLVLERVEGETLSQRLKRGALPVEEALQIGAQMAYALEAAHEQGIVHRDVKPGNVMIGLRGLVKVLDFGLARRLVGLRDEPRRDAGEPAETGDSVRILTTFRLTPEADAIDEDAPTIGLPPVVDGTFSLTGWTVGTPGYMSPEQCLAEPVDQRGDIFSFASVLYECLSGRRAFRSGSPVEIMRATLNEEPDFALLPRRTPDRVRTMLQRCFAKQADARPQDMRLIRIELEEALGIRRASALREGQAYTTPNNLPAQPMSFVGREALLAECGETLDRVRLLTLAGLGGSGKTRLALQLAQARLDAFSDGVWFVDIAPLLEPERVAEVLAATLGVREEPGRPVLEGILLALAEKRALLLLDNCETQIEACSEIVTALLRGCRDLKVLLTSREPLGTEGEVMQTVPALQVPAAATHDPAAAMTSEAVRLFVERAIVANPAFTLAADNTAAVVEICTRLDGLPLALELAAARVRMLSAEQIRARLDDRFKLLTRGPGGSARQQTVHATIAWSYDHLLAPEQDLVWRLAAFTGGWTLERAVQVCSESGDEFEMLDLLTRLVERALVVVQRVGEQVVRYRYLESVWRFALERAAEQGEFASVRARHLDEFLRFVEESEPVLTGADSQKRFAELQAEEGNIMGAFDLCLHAPGHADEAMRLASAAQRYWSIAGRYTAALRALDDALALDHDARPTPIRAKALTRRSAFLLTSGEHAAARGSLGEALAISRALGDRAGMARVLAGLGVAAMWQDDLEAAAAYTEESAAIYHELGQPRGVGMARHNLGTVLLLLERYDDALVQLVSAREMLERVNDRLALTLVLSSIASGHVAMGRADAAREALARALELLAELEVPREAVHAFEACAGWAHLAGHSAEAATLMGAVRAQRETYRLAYMRPEQAECDALLAKLAGALGASECERLAAVGARWTVHEALVAALALVKAPQPA